MQTTVDAEEVQPTTALVRREESAVMQPQELVDQVQLIQRVMRDVMKEGEHYGKIPGCGNKPALLKAGAEKLGMTFRLAPTFDIRRTDMANGHREYEVICTLNGKYQGVGTCSTMEGKYRYRGNAKEFTGMAVPKAYWDLRRDGKAAEAQELIGGKGFSTAKNDTNVWEVVKLGEKQEHDNPADFYNTVLKMAKKRAHVDAVLTATAASDIFAQDIEEMHDPPAPAPAPPEPPKKQPMTDEEKLTRFIKATEEFHPELLQYARANDWITEGQHVSNIPVDKIPKDKESWERLKFTLVDLKKIANTIPV